MNYTIFMKASKLIFLFAIFVFYNCTNSKKELQPEPVLSEDEVKIDIPADLIEDSAQAINGESELFFMRNLVDKYPTQVDLFRNEILLNRFKNMDRFNTENLVANWNTETPLAIEDEIIHSSGCQDNDCPNNAFELFIDLKNDNINIYNFKGNMLRIYKEKELIDLPIGFKQELEIKKSNAKIGDINDTKSEYKLEPQRYSPNNSNIEVADQIRTYLTTNLLKNDLKVMTEDQRYFQYEQVDLNEDGIFEYIIGFQNSYFCGTGGCTFMLINNDGSLVSKFSVSEAPFIVSNAKSNGYKDLIVSSKGKLHLLKYNGKTYPGNPSVAPNYDEIPGDDLARLLWNEFPIPTFEF